MELKPRKIPLDLLHSLPDGIKFVSKHGHDFLIVDDVRCPAGHNLVDASVRIHGEPAIRLFIDTGASSGLVFVDAFWGGHAKLYSFIPIISRQRHLLAFCPHCRADLLVTEPCQLAGCDCDQAILLSLPDGRNRIYACARLGCAGHHIEIADVPKKISDEIDGINYFGAVEDDLFGGI